MCKVTRVIPNIFSTFLSLINLWLWTAHIESPLKKKVNDWLFYATSHNLHHSTACGQLKMRSSRSPWSSFIFGVWDKSWNALTQWWLPIDDTAPWIHWNVSSVLLTECVQGPDDLGNFLVPFPYQTCCRLPVLRMRATLSSERNVT